MAANTTSTEAPALTFVEQQAEVAQTLFGAHGLSLADLEATVVEFYLFYFPLVTKDSYEDGETRRGEVASRWVREEIAKEQGQAVVDDNDRLIRTACAYATALLLEAYDQLGDTLAQQAAAATLRQEQVEQAKGKIDATRSTGVFGQAIEAYFAAALRIGRLDVFVVDHEGTLRRESVESAVYRLAREALCAELGEEVVGRRQSSIGKGLGLAKGLLKDAIAASRRQ